MGLVNSGIDSRGNLDLDNSNVKITGGLLTINAPTGSNTNLPLSGDILSTTTPIGSANLADVNSDVGTFGSSTQVGVFTVNAKGQITAASNASIAGSPPSGSAGGDLSGTYPNPTVAKINGVTLGPTAATAGNLLIGSGVLWNSTPMSGDATINATGGLTIANNAVTTAKIANGAADLTTKVSGVLPVANGGNNSATQTTNGVLFNNGTANTSSASLTYDGVILNAQGGAANTITRLFSLQSPRSFATANDGVMFAGVSSAPGILGTHDYGALVMGSNPATGNGGASSFQLRVGGSSTNTTNNGIFLQALSASTNSTTEIAFYLGASSKIASFLGNGTTIGVLSMPKTPFVFATSTVLQNNVTGNGTTYTVIFNSVETDQTGSFNSTTSTFTAPITGNYEFTATVAMQNLAAAFTQYLISFFIAGTNYVFSQGNPTGERAAGGTNQLTRMISIKKRLTAGQTCQVRLQVSGATLTVGILNANQTSFQAAFLS